MYYFDFETPSVYRSTVVSKKVMQKAVLIMQILNHTIREIEMKKYNICIAQ